MGVAGGIPGGGGSGAKGWTGTPIGGAGGRGEIKLVYTIPVCTTASGGSITGTNAVCFGAANTLSLTGLSGVGFTYQWRAGAVGGPYTTNLGTAETQSTSGLAAGTYGIVCDVTCPGCGPCTVTTAEFQFTSKAIPTATAGSNSPVCAGTPLNLTGTTDVGTTFNWTGPNAFLNGTQSPQVSTSATLAMVGTYTFTATLNGCTSAPSTTSVLVVAAPQLTATTATPNPTCFNGNSQLQVTESTAFKASTGSLDPMAGAATLLTTSNDDTPTAASTPIGFSFIFNGTPYTDFSVSPDGWILLGTTVAASQFTNTTTSTTNIPKIYPYWDDMATGTTGNVRSVVTGVAPNRILKVQWFVTIPRNTTGAANSTFQAWLYENGGQIDFRYGAMGPGSMSASVGTTTSATIFRSVTISSNTMSTVTANDANAGQPAAGLVYSFNFPASSYLWNPGSFLSSTTVANPLATGVNVASQAYTVTATNADNCTAQGTITVNTSAPITAATITGNLGYCTGLSTTLTAVPTDGAGPFTYLWAPGGQTSAAISVNAAGSYSCQVTDACGGSVNTGNVTVVENNLPTVAVDVPSTNFCTGYPQIALTASGASTYSWAPAAGLSATTGTSVNANPTTTTTYTVTGTDGNGCVNAATSAITVLGAAPVIASTTSVSPICPGSTSQLQVNVQGPAAYCTSTHTSGCSGDNISNVTLNTLNNATGTACGGTSHYTYFNGGGAQTTTLAAGGSYTVSCTFGTDGNQYFGAWIDYDNSGTFEASEFLGASANAGASGTIGVSFTVPAAPVNGILRLRVVGGNDAAVTATQACGASSSPWGETQDYDVTITGGAAQYTYAWTPAGNLDNAAITNPVATLTTSEAYTVTVTNAAGCVALGTTSVSVPTVDDGDPCTLDACASGVVTHTFQDADSDGICDANDPCPNLANLQNGDPCDDGNVCTINDVVAGCVCAGTFQDTDADGVCDANDNCPTVTGQQGSACDDGNPLTTGDVLNALCVCAGLAVDCEGTPSGPAVPGTPCNDADPCTLNDTWSPSCVCVGTYTDTDGDGICNALDNCPNLAGVQGDACSDGNACTINDVITASCVCAGTPAPVTAGVTASSPVYCTPGAGVTLTASGGDTYSWAPAASLSASTGNPVTATPSATTTYTVTASNAVGCTGTATVTITTGAFPATPVTSATPSTVCPGSDSQLAAQIGGTPSYCTTSYSNGTAFGDYLTSVNILTTTLNNSTGASASPYYTLYPASGSTTTTLTAGSTYTLTCVAGTYTQNDVAAWIDYNNNGVFDAPAEKLGEVDNFGASPTQANITFTVPLTALNGEARLRVRESDQATTGSLPACGAQTYGEVEDYTVTIAGGAPPCAPGINFSWSPTTYLSNPLVCNPVATAMMVTTAYTVTATNAAGCSSTANITVNVETADADNDGTVDCLDGCPADPNKTAPGQCGCGVADTDTDSDGTADCNDGCPADANKTAPGICGCGVADTDTDGDLTADCNDGCPTDPNKIAPGQCGCGVADTDTDSDGVADCVDSCPSVPGVVGTPCNDGNAGTINDVLTEACVCAGTVPVCTFNTVLLDLVTDNNGGQTSWDVVNVGTTTVVCSGSGYLNNQTITLDCCLPNGCYELRVFDSAGDGMANGPIGGYVLRANGSGNKRIIDNSGDGIFTSTSTIANNLGFCVPIGTDAPIASSCDKNNWLPNDILQATTNAAVTAQFGVTNATSGYQFWFFNPDGGYSRRITQTHAAPGSVTGPAANVRASYLRLNAIVTQPLPFYTNLNIRIRTQVAGVFSEFGPACRFRLDPPCSTTQLTSVADPVVSCGATGLTLSSTIYATAVAGASTYQFEFSKPGYLRRIAQSVRSTALSFTTNPLQNNNCYSVRLRVSFDGGLTYCPFGPSCNITIGTALCGSAMALDAGDGLDQAAEGQLTVWPNPNDGSLVNVSLTEFDVNVNTVGVDVTDIYGKLVSTRTIPVQDGYLKTTMTFEQDLAPGLYLVNLTVGEKRYTERLVIQ